MQNNNIVIKVNKNNNFTSKIPKPAQKPNKILKFKLPENNLKINSSIDKTPKNIKSNNFIPNSTNKKGNSTKNIILINKTPNNIKYNNYISKNSAVNSNKKLFAKDKPTTITRLPSSSIIEPKINAFPQRMNSKKIKIEYNSNIKRIGSGVISGDKIYEDKKYIYNKKKVNNFVSKKSSEQKLEKISKKNEDKKYESLTTFEKIIELQNLLKEMNSIKERFEYNKDKMNEKLYLNCYNYYNDKVYMKEIFDYCISRKPEEHKNYKLISNIQDYLDNNLYNSLYDFFFLIRNNYNLLIQIINNFDKFFYAELSDFLANFFYENIIDSSFTQPELIILIYFLLEDLFSKINLTGTSNDNIYIYIKDSFLFNVFQSLTRKIDVRNFLHTILNDIIVKMESFRVPLSVHINIVNRFLKIRDINMHHSFIQFTKGDSDDVKIKKTKKNFKNQNIIDIPYNKGARGNESAFLKRTKRIELGSSSKFNNLDGSWVIIPSKLSESRTFNDSNTNNNNNNNDLNTSINENENNILDNNKISNEENNLIEDNYKSTTSKDIKVNLNLKKDIEIPEIDPFFEKNSVTLKFLNDKLFELRKSINKKTINFAMKEYLNSLIYQIESKKSNKNLKSKKSNEIYVKKISSSSNDKLYEKIENNIDDNDYEIFSTSLIIDELKSIRVIKQVDNFKQLMKKIIINYKIVTKIITNLITKIKDNLNYIPYVLKIITKMLNYLLFRKYGLSFGVKLSHYNLYMLNINFLIGNILLPIILNPEYNGIITTDIISQITKENLSLIFDIFNKILSGKLFNKKDDPYMTLFNPFIIEIIPKLFELVDNLEKNFKFPFYIQKLIDKKTNARNFVYNYFQENYNENIQYQSICFSWQNFYILLQVVSKNRNIFIDKNNNKEQRIILEKLIENKDKFINLFSHGLKKKTIEYFIVTKINYRDELSKKLSSIVNDNFNLIIPKLNNDLITAYKKCLSETLCYVNILHKENIIPFTLRKEKVIHDKNIIKQINKNIRKDQYERIINNSTNSKKLKINLKYNIPLLIGDKEDADFRKVIFPQILDNIKYEISSNLNNPITQRIIFCCNYLKLYMRNIPTRYKLNNFGLLFTELIQETKKNIEYLKNDILFEYYLKLNEAQKSNLLLSNYCSQIRNLEKLECIEYLYSKLELPIKLNILKDKNGIITNIEYSNNNKNDYDNLNKNENVNIMDYLENRNQPIKNFIDSFPNFHEYEEEFDDILDIEEKANVPEAINSYFSALKNLVKKEKIINKYNKEELDGIIYDLENYILTKLYNKLFPSETNKDDIFFYKKCVRLDFIKPENVVADKKIINENLMENAIDYLNSIDDKLTPIDKIKSFAKAIEIIQNSIAFSSGKDELGVDDTIKPLIYVMIKSKPKNISTNFQYCELYLNSELAKKQYGVILTQIGLIIGIIKNMKYNDLIGVSQEQFGVDKMEEEDNEN